VNQKLSISSILGELVRLMLRRLVVPPSPCLELRDSF